jgi:hypothetical protein
LPTDRITGASRTPTLSWNAVQGATTYDLQVSNSTAFTTTVIDQKSIALTSFNISSVLAGRTLYLWRVRSVSNGVAGPWSTALRFTTVR